MQSNPERNTPARTGSAPGDTWLLYDGECPFCSRYVNLLRLRAAIGDVRLIDARKGGPEVGHVHRSGLGIDEGMVLHHNGELFHGAECIHHIALLTTPSHAFNTFNAWLFRSGPRSRFIYPILLVARNATLKLLGRTPIEQSPVRIAME